MSSKKKKIDSTTLAENEEINVNFEGSNAGPQDLDGIKQLLLQLFLKAHINVTELADIIIGQNYIGSVIKQYYEDDEELSDDEDPNLVFGITTLVGLDNHFIPCIEQISRFLLEKAEKNADQRIFNTFKDATENQKVGLLINERFVNIPAQISLPLFESLDAELKRAVSKNKPFNFSSVILISKFYRKIDSNGKVIEDILSNLEEEVFTPFISVSFDYNVQHEADSGNWEKEESQLIPYRKVSLLDAQKLSEIINSLKSFLQ